MLLYVLMMHLFFFLAYFDLSCLQTIFIFNHSKQETKVTLVILDLESKHVGVLKTESILFKEEMHIGFLTSESIVPEMLSITIQEENKILCINIGKEETKVSISQMV